MTRNLNPIEEAERAGFDMSLVNERSSYSYEQRAVHHQAALNHIHGADRRRLNTVDVDLAGSAASASKGNLGRRSDLMSPASRQE
jgi:hypothetical protein